MAYTAMMAGKIESARSPILIVVSTARNNHSLALSGLAKSMRRSGITAYEQG